MVPSMRSKQHRSTTGAKRFQKLLLAWYNENKRDLPWRINPTPYRIWISEIMLQQTQAKTVIPYFNRFMKRFPSLESLARASEPEVLEFWAGLGYYNRARNLLKAARQIINLHGSFPRELKAILALPGVGRYTAGAICSLAFHQKLPVVDGNVRRLLIRLNAIKRHVPDSNHWNQMSALLPDERVSSFNQAMMELGALVCVPFQPLCHRCPVTGFCEARKLAIQDSIPVVRSKQVPKHVSAVILVLKHSGRILLVSKRKPSFIPGEWGLPCSLMSKGISAAKAASLLCSDILGRTVPLTPIRPIRHCITRYRIFACGFCGEIRDSIFSLRKNGRIRWMPYNSGKRLLTSSLFRKILEEHFNTDP